MWRQAVVVLVLALAAPATAAIFPVTKTADTADGVCDADCSLREAIIAANTASGDDEITLPAGTYQLSIPQGGDSAGTGDLDIVGGLTITGAGAATTIIDGGDVDRIFDVKTVGKARSLAARGQTKCADGTTKATKKAGRDLKKVGRALGGYRRGLSSRRARKQLPESVRADFLARVEPLLADVKAFTRQVTCPEGSPAGGPAR